MLKFFEKRYGLSNDGAKYLLVAIITTIFMQLSLLLPAIYSFIFLNDYFDVTKKHLPNIGVYVGISIGMFLVMFIFSYIQYKMTYTKIYTSTCKTRIQMADKIKMLPIAYFGKRDLVSFSATMTKNASNMEQIFSHSVPQIYASTLVAIMFCISMFAWRWEIALALFWVLPVSAISLIATVNKQKNIYRDTRNDNLALENEMQNAFDMANEIKAYKYESHVIEKTDKRLKTLFKSKIKSELYAGVMMNICKAIIRLGIVSTAIVAIILYGKGSVGQFGTKFGEFELVASLIASVAIYAPYESAISDSFMLQYVFTNIEVIQEMKNFPVQTGADELKNNGYDIEFKNVSFEYEKEEGTIKDVSFTAKQGEVTALVGPSGGGKSTLAKLAARFWDVNSGTITLGGADISKVMPERLLQEYSVVFQDVLLFNNSILENIRMGRKDATDEEVFAVAKLANCDEFVSRLPDGYNTEIGENGSRLSGGERQRISIARAMLKNSPVILLDEATASLDAECESSIQRALSELIKNKTVIVIAHRMRTVVNADKVVVINNGKIEASGSPNELMKKKGYFAEALKLQAQ